MFFGFVLVAAGLIGYRLFILAVVNHSAYSRTAQAQNENITNVVARGNIYLSNGGSDTVLAATNKKFPLAYVVPADVQSKDQVAESLSKILSIEKKEIQQKLDTNSTNPKVILRRISNQQVDEIEKLKTKGVGVSYELDRFYPGGYLAANVLGFFGYGPEGKRAGQYGIEEYYDQELFGRQTSPYSFFAVNPFSIFKNETDNEKSYSLASYIRERRYIL